MFKKELMKFIIIAFSLTFTPVSCNSSVNNNITEPIIDNSQTTKGTNNNDTNNNNNETNVAEKNITLAYFDNIENVTTYYKYNNNNNNSNNNNETTTRYKLNESIEKNLYSTTTFNSVTDKNASSNVNDKTEIQPRFTQLIGAFLSTSAAATIPMVTTDNPSIATLTTNSKLSPFYTQIHHPSANISSTPLLTTSQSVLMNRMEKQTTAVLNGKSLPINIIHRVPQIENNQSKILNSNLNSTGWNEISTPKSFQTSFSSTPLSTEINLSKKLIEISNKSTETQEYISNFTKLSPASFTPSVFTTESTTDLSNSSDLSSITHSFQEISSHAEEGSSLQYSTEAYSSTPSSSTMDPLAEFYLNYTRIYFSKDLQPINESLQTPINFLPTPVELLHTSTSKPICSNFSNTYFADDCRTIEYLTEILNDVVVNKSLIDADVDADIAKISVTTEKSHTTTFRSSLLEEYINASIIPEHAKPRQVMKNETFNESSSIVYKPSTIHNMTLKVSPIILLPKVKRSGKFIKNSKLINENPSKLRKNNVTETSLTKQRLKRKHIWKKSEWKQVKMKREMSTSQIVNESSFNATFRTISPNISSSDNVDDYDSTYVDYSEIDEPENTTTGPADAAVFPDPDSKNEVYLNKETEAPLIGAVVEDSSIEESDLHERDVIDSVMYIYFGGSDSKQIGAGRQILIVGAVIALVAQFLTLVGGVKRIVTHHAEEPTIILLNIEVALTLTNLVFLLGVQATRNQHLCKLVALTLHYLHVTTLSWFMIGLLYTLHSTRQKHPTWRLSISYLVGWLAPFAFVAINYNWNSRCYETEIYCWISPHRGALFSYILPLTIFSAVCASIYIIMCKENLVEDEEDKDIYNFRRLVQVNAVSLPLFSLVWFCGMISLENSLSFLYSLIFLLCDTVLNWLLFAGWLPSEECNQWKDMEEDYYDDEEEYEDDPILVKGKNDQIVISDAFECPIQAYDPDLEPISIISVS